MNGSRVDGNCLFGADIGTVFEVAVLPLLFSLEIETWEYRDELGRQNRLSKTHV
jgi:hypothetical protein